MDSEIADKVRKSEHKNVSKQQAIICYIPEKREGVDFCVYNGLPTKHRLNIPMSIDAPFELTTSREEIETDKEEWNDHIRKEFYRAIINVMLQLRDKEGIKILRFIKYKMELHGRLQVYVNDISDSGFLKEFSFTDLLRKEAILPTYQEKHYAIPSLGKSFRYPPIAKFLFSRNEFGSIERSSIIKDDDLEYLCVERTDSEQEDYSFPEETVKNEEALNRSINRLIQNPSTIESEIRPHKVYVVKNKDGKTFSLDSDEARSAALRRYNPDLRRKYCFCQMCKRLKSYSFIEVNNIELLPKNYFPQLRIALCLECSKKYILFRNNDKKAKKFIKAIRSSSYSGKANVSIPIDAFSSITFTAIHFAEIQRILNSTLFNE